MTTEAVAARPADAGPGQRAGAGDVRAPGRQRGAHERRDEEDPRGRPVRHGLSARAQQHRPPDDHDRAGRNVDSHGGQKIPQIDRRQRTSRFAGVDAGKQHGKDGEAEPHPKPERRGHAPDGGPEPAVRRHVRITRAPRAEDVEQSGPAGG